ncbi:MAG: disulfide bond formation protein DsbA [Verrucomicrobia bacterium]|nr:disulfide bond formation protein DsbA [Verrucomicrobiota bacterium]MBI3870365.1 disulfide bond formation protein DsbA [Verrucomicrobiota bacterium]
MRITYYLDVVSSWCCWAEPAWAELKREFGASVQFDWKVALMDAAALPVSEAQELWFYRRSGTLMRSPRLLNSRWFEAGLKEYLAPNAVSEAARQMGIHDDCARLAIADAAMRDGVKVGRWQEAVDVAAKECSLNAAELMRRARSPEVEAAVRASTAEFHAFKMTVRPAFLLENSIGDRAMFSGIAVAAPIASTLRAMLSDAAGYASYAAHHGEPPAG